MTTYEVERDGDENLEVLAGVGLDGELRSRVRCTAL